VHMKKWLTHWGLALAALLWLTACAGNTHVAAVAANTPTTGPLKALPARAGYLDVDAAIERIIGKMTLDQKIGQMLMVEFEGTDYNGDLDAMLHNSHAGGVIIYNNNARTIPQMQTLMATAQSHADLPLMVAIDQEGGDVNRLSEFYGAAPSAMQLGATGDPTQAQAQGALDAQRMLNLGLNVNLAPDVDVSDGVGGGVDLTRMWGNTPGKVAMMAGAFLDGLQANGVAGSLKHWPGIGAVHSDPHLSLPVLDHSVAQLNAIDFAPFKDLLAHGPAMIMTTHVIVPTIDPDHPASLSPKLVDGILRQQLGYQGVIITDQLHMDGIYDYLRQYLHIEDFPTQIGQAGVLAVQAGNDILEGAFDSFSTSTMLSAIKTAVQHGEIPLSRIEASDRRILRLKWAYAMGLPRLIAAAGPAPLPQAQVAVQGAAFTGSVPDADVRHAA
jgi:beta-N-acetylhexosaminidase